MPGYSRPHNEVWESKREEFRKRFRRSGSLGIPFINDGDIPILKDYFSEPASDGRPLLTVVVAAAKKTSGLAHIMKVIENLSVSLQHIESRDAKHREGEVIEILVQIQLRDSIKPELVMEKLKNGKLEVAEIACTVPPVLREGDEDFLDDPGLDDILGGCPWFPRSISDLDKSSKRVLMYGSELEADHPGFTDSIYRERRMMFAEIALNYKHGEPIPRVEYTEAENATWGTIYKELRVLHLKYACKEYLDNFVLLEKYCGYSEKSIPQLDDISRFLKAKTGFQVRPVAGYLSARDFLAGLAFRVFHCTQYIRHPSDPFYSPEPDCCHELMGHMPLFAEPDFAQFSQEIGLASLGASDDDVKKLATVYFFTIEFGLCKTSSTPLKVYGAGLLSSVAELKYVVEGKPEIHPFDPDRVIAQECMITCFQTAYFYTSHFEEALQKIRLLTSNMSRPFVVRHNPYTQSVEVLNNKRSLTLAINSMRSDINLLAGALHKVL